mgnify:FL=1|tara:strand:+ start:1650 stop:2897 length:1248 start_codon:yes stop_codon:yes gene_type:complete
MINKQINISSYYFIACISFVLGLFMQDFFKVPLTGGIIIIGLSWIFSFSFKEKLQRFMKNPAAIAFVLLYLLHLVSLFYTENSSEGWNDLRLKISFLLLPFFMMTVQFIYNEQRMVILKLFAVLMMLMALTDLTNAFLEYFVNGNQETFYYIHLPYVLASKVHYVAWYYSFAIFISIYHLIYSHSNRPLWFIGLLILLFSLILLSSRAFILAFIVVFILSFLKWFKTAKVSRFMWAKLLSIAALFIFTLALIPSTNLRINDTVVELQKMFGYDTPKQTNPRVFIWRYGANLIAKNPIFGFGVGDAKGELSAALESCDAMFWNGERNIPIQNKNYNFHNQFMQTWAEVGIFGFLILLFIMIHPFLLKSSHPLFLIFIGLTFIGCLTESMFERQAGVVLFAFMYPLLSGLKNATDEY